MLSYKEWLWMDNINDVFTSLLQLLEISNLDTVPIPLEFLKEYSNILPDLRLLINEDIINGVLILFKKYHFDSIVGDDFLQLLSRWIELDLHLVWDYILQFCIDIIRIYYNSNTTLVKESSEELVGNSIFTYSIELLKILLNESQKSSQWPSSLTNDFVKFQTDIL